eukprot:UN16531
MLKKLLRLSAKAQEQYHEEPEEEFHPKKEGTPETGRKMNPYKKLNFSIFDFADFCQKSSATMIPIIFNTFDTNDDDRIHFNQLDKVLGTLMEIYITQHKKKSIIIITLL